MPFLLMLLAYLLAVASASKNDIAVRSRPPELSASMDEDFASMLKVSFYRSKCCNVLISGESATALNLLKKFVSVYPHAYTLNNTTSLCNGYVIISTASLDKLKADMRSVPTAILTTELLIFFDREVEESLGLFNVSMYDKVNVNIGAPNGLWTLQKDSFLAPVFKKISSHRDIKPRQRVNFQGKQLIATTFYKPPFCYLQTSENRTVNGLSSRYFIAKNESEADGIEFKLFTLIAERLNFTWAITQPSDDDRYGSLNGTKWVGGLIAQVVERQVDIGFASVWFVEDVFKASNTTRSWGFQKTKFLVPRPKPHLSFWALTETLSPTVWAVILAALITQTLYVWVHAWLTTRGSKRFRNLAVTLTAMMGILIGSWYPRKTQGLQFQLKLWNFVGIVLVIAYSSSLAATLTNCRYEKRIDTTQDFIQANLTWGRSAFTRFKHLFDKLDPYAEQIPEHFVPENGTTDRHESILQGNYAVIGTTLSGIFFPDETIDSEDLKGFRVMKQHTSGFEIPFVAQPWLVGPVDEIMLRLQEAGLVQYLIQDVLHRRTGYALREVLVEKDQVDDSPSVLRLLSLGTGFLTLIIGAVTSTVVFCLELRSANKERSIRQAIVEINRRRAIWDAKELKRKREKLLFQEFCERNFGYVIPRSN